MQKKIIFTKPFVPVSRRMSLTLPLSALYLASYLKRNSSSRDAEIIDPDLLLKESFTDFTDLLIKKKPDIICVTVFSHVLAPARKLLKELKRGLPKSVFIIGGSHVNAVKEKSLEHIPETDYAIYGEGEKSLVQFYGQFEKEGRIYDFSRIPGIIYRDKGKICSVSNSYTDNLDEFDPLDYSLINIPDYFRLGSPMGLFRKGNNVAQIITTRGCPFACTFCASPVNMGKKVRKRSADSIVREIETLISYGTDEIHLMDDNFTFSRQHVLELTERLLSKNIKINFCMPNGVRIDKLDQEMLEAMRKAGWYHLGFGIEVGSDEALKKIQKGITLAQIKEKVAIVKKAGFTTAGFFILGFPHDTVNTMKETVVMPDKLGLDMASFGNYTPLPGTQLFNELVKNNEIDKDYQPSFATGEITYCPRGTAKKDLERIQKYAVLKYWLNPKRIKLIASRIKKRDLRYVSRRLFQIIFRQKPAVR